MSEGWKPWCWAFFAFNTLFSGIFAFLCWFTFSAFSDLTSNSKLVFTDFDKKSWQWLFNGAAGSAFFALILVILNVLTALYYMVFSRKHLGHPRMRYGKGVMVAMTFYTSLHICNIAVHFISFKPAMLEWNKLGANFNTSLLAATAAFGFISWIFHMIFTVIILFWRDTEAERLEVTALGGAGV